MGKGAAMTKVTNKQPYSKEFLKSYIREIAEKVSAFKKINYLKEQLEFYIKNPNLYPDSQEQRDTNWHEACCLLILKIFDIDAINFSQIPPSSFPIFESIWLKELKKLKSYYMWEESENQDQDKNYFLACEEIRQVLYKKSNYPINDFDIVEKYIDSNYLTDGKIDEKKVATNILISNKASRIHTTTLNESTEENWHRAKLYVQLFYNNIIPAVKQKDKECIVNVLKALQFSKSQENRYLIINTFEAATVIFFLNKVILNKLINDQHMCSFNMVPVSDWPAKYKSPISVKNRFRYDKDNKQIIFEGKMEESEKQELLNSLIDSNKKNDLDKLYDLCRLGPLHRMIL